MELFQYFKSVVDLDRAAVVLCDLRHEIIYMNPAAEERYKGRAAVGQCLLDCHGERSDEMIKRVVEWFSEDVSHNIIYTLYSERENMDVYMTALRGENGELIGYYEKHECRTRESMAAYDFENGK